MTTDETIILMMALTAPDGILTTNDAYQAVGYKPAWEAIPALMNAGAIDRPRRGQMVITEKGRIACALAMHKDPSLHVAFFEDSKAV